MAGKIRHNFVSLQLARGIAALLVLFFHLGGTIRADKYYGNDFLPWLKIFQFGDSGVEFFFVLSGFLIAYIHWDDLNKPSSFSKYIIKRFARIYPTYWLILFSVIFFAIFFQPLRQTLPLDVSTYLWTIMLVPLDKNVVGGTGAPILGVAWTLHYEIFFYLIFGLGILNFRLGMVALAISTFYAVKNFGINAEIQFPLSFFAEPYILFFLLGVLAAAIFLWQPGLPAPWTILAFGISGFLFTAMFDIFFKEYSVLDNRMDRKISYSIFSFFIISSLVELERKKMLVLNNQIFISLGDISYPLYLVHFPVISAITKLFCQCFPKTLFFGVSNIVLIIIFCVLVSSVIHYYFERPILSKVKILLSRFPGSLG